MPEEKGRLDFNHRGTGLMELDSNVILFHKIKKQNYYLYSILG